MNSYPFLPNKHKPIFTSDLGDIVHRVRRHRVIDISDSPRVRASSLRAKLEGLHQAGELDGGLPIVRDGILVGLIPAPDLEFALDNLDDEESTYCLMTNIPSIDDSDDGERDPTDFTPYIDPVSDRKRRKGAPDMLTIIRLRSLWTSNLQWTWFMSAFPSLD
jgi:chloride channel 3/4/5